MMIKNCIIALCAVLILFAGCGDLLTAAAGSTSNSGGVSGAQAVPGSGGKTVDDLNFYLDAEGVPQLKVYSMDDGIDPDVVTTQETLGTWKDGKAQNKFSVQGLSYMGSSSLSQDGYSDSYFLYYYKPFDGPFKFSARVRMTAVQAFATSKGLYMGAHVSKDTPKPNGDQVFGSRTRSAGILFRSGIGSNDPTAEIRYYFCPNNNGAFHAGNSTAGGQGDQILYGMNYKTEYILEISRAENSAYTYAVKNSSTGVIEPNTIKPANNPRTITNPYTSGSTVTLDPLLVHGQPVFLGIAMLGSSAEISQIRIWDISNPADDGSDDDDHLVFFTPDSEPGYVPVERLNITFAPSVSPAAGTPPRYTFTYGQMSGGIALTPVVTPAYANNKYVEWIMESCDISGAMSIAGTGVPHTWPGVFENDGTTLKRTWPAGSITLGSIPSGQTAHAVFKGVARDLELDDFEGFPPADYALQQLLPEYRFEVNVTAP